MLWMYIVGMLVLDVAVIVTATLGVQVFTPSLYCAAMLLGVTLRGMALALQEEDKEQLEVG